MTKKNHFWIAPKLAGDLDLVSARAACGTSMYPDVGTRPEFSEEPSEVTCGSCRRTHHLRNIQWFDTFTGK